MLKIKSVRNVATLDVMNSCLDMVVCYSKEILGILDLKLVGIYYIKQGILQQNLGKYYRFESADILCEQFNKFINTLRKENEEMQERYAW